MRDKIYIKGACEHNLKNIDAKYQGTKLVVITGLSGSGKSSLAFDTIYAEAEALCGIAVIIRKTVPGPHGKAGGGIH